MTAHDDAHARISAIIRDRLAMDVLSPHTDLIDEGLLDSLALVMLITALEDSYACELPLDDFDLDDFRSVARITEYLDGVGLLRAREPW